MKPQNPQNHDHIRQRVFAYDDGELPEAERPAVLAHLEGCSDCRTASRRWATLAGALLRTPPPTPSDAFVRRVMARVEVERRERLSVWAVWEGAWRWLVPALGVGVAALALVVTTPRSDASVSTDALLLAGSTGSGAFEAMMQQDNPDTEEVLGLAMERPVEER